MPNPNGTTKSRASQCSVSCRTVKPYGGRPASGQMKWDASSCNSIKARARRSETKGAKVMYFVTEHSRVGGLKGEVGAKSYKELTDKTVCNKFVLVRAEL